MTGSLQVKKGFYYAVLNLRDSNGKTKQKWISSGLPERNNKRKAEQFLKETIREYEEKKITVYKTIPFADFMTEWLEIIRPQVKDNTYYSYALVVKNSVVPYFKDNAVTLQDLEAIHIQKYYNKKLKEGVSGNTIKHHHANIRKALEYAVKQNWIPYNPASRVELPRIKQFQVNFYDDSQIKQLIESAKNSVIEVPVLLTAIYGLRRSEVLGLKWDAIDFKKQRITVKRTLVVGNEELLLEDSTKNSSSRRSLTLIPKAAEVLLLEHKKQQELKELFGNEYHDEGFVCTMPDGRPIRPDYISRHFKNLLIEKSLPVIRFHDLRHSSASLLIANGFSLKEVGEWLGHSCITTTNRYAHLLSQATVDMANSVENALFPETLNALEQPLEQSGINESETK